MAGCRVFRLVLTCIRATKSASRLWLVVRWSVRVATLGTEHLPKMLVLPVVGPVSIVLHTPAEAKPACVRKMMVSVSLGTGGVTCALAKAEGEIATVDHHVTQHTGLAACIGDRFVSNV